ncbi:MAG TPA: glucose-6-phosphate isomerase, partial [Desulfocapsa sulfexigens]|nr:glucose-6-phosphate isomerase [Desulfocapsa sulfexigens]
MAREWKSIYDCRAFSTLKHLSEEPFDLSAEKALTPERLEDFLCKGSEFDLLYGCQRVTSEVLGALQSLVDECDLLGQFARMRAGDVMNRLQHFPSEDRQVLHT